MFNYKCYNIKAEAKLCWAGQGFERSRRAPYCCFGLNKEHVSGDIVLYFQFLLTYL